MFSFVVDSSILETSLKELLNPSSLLAMSFGHPPYQKKGQTSKNYNIVSIFFWFCAMYKAMCPYTKLCVPYNDMYYYRCLLWCPCHKISVLIMAMEFAKHSDYRLTSNYSNKHN